MTATRTIRSLARTAVPVTLACACVAACVARQAPVLPGLGEADHDAPERIVVPPSEQRVTHYNAAEPVAAPLGPAEERVVALMEETARSMGVESPALDPRLSRAAKVMALGTRGIRPPPVPLTRYALSSAGIIENNFLHLYGRVQGREPSGDAAAQMLGESLQGALRQHGHTHFGVGARTELDYLTVLVIVLQRRIVATEPIAVRLDAGVAMRVKAQLAEGYTDPILHVTQTDGHVRTQQLALNDGRAMRIPIVCGDSAGVMRFEIMATSSRGGPEVAANFPVWCGEQPPQGFSMTVAPWQERFPASEAQAESELLDRVNEARAAAGLTPLEADGSAAEVARAHSADMRDHRFFGHLSPTTGLLADRLRTAELAVPWAAENVGTGSSVQEIHDSLMASPGHRKAILAPGAQRLGVGVALGDNVTGIPSVFVTEVFVADRAPPPEDSKPATRADTVQLAQDEQSVAECTVLGMHNVLLHRVDDAALRVAQKKLRAAAKRLRGNTVLAERKHSRHGDRLVGTVYRCP